MADVHGHVQNGAARHADQLVLGVGRRLEVQAAHGAYLRRQGVIVLHKIQVDAQLVESRPVVGLAEKPAMIAKLVRLDNLDVRDVEGADLEGHECYRRLYDMFQPSS